MKFVDEFRDGDVCRRMAALLHRKVTRPWTVMEVCGGQTHAIVRFGIDQLLPPSLSLLHGPGCPVCVTPVEVIDEALRLARDEGVILCTFGDMLRVPGTSSDLARERAAGADVRVVYSPLDAIAIARAEPARTVVVLAIGFETTAPVHATLVLQAAAAGVDNLCLLSAHVLVPPALEAILAPDPDHPEAPRRVDGFLAAGHVCAVMGTRAYEPIAARYQVPIVVTGFEPADILRGLVMLVDQLESGRSVVENAYDRVVGDDGNAVAQSMVERVFEVVDRRWRGLGDLTNSGLQLREAYARFDAERRFRRVALHVIDDDDDACRAGLVLTGRMAPDACPSFGTRCTPDSPLGAPMVSSEGACAAFARYRGLDAATTTTVAP